MTKETVEDLTKALVIRVLDVYRPDYIEKCFRDEPESLLGLAKRLALRLEQNGENFHLKESWLTPVPHPRQSPLDPPNPSRIKKSA